MFSRAIFFCIIVFGTLHAGAKETHGPYYSKFETKTAIYIAVIYCILYNQKPLNNSKSLGQLGCSLQIDYICENSLK